MTKKRQNHFNATDNAKQMMGDVLSEIADILSRSYSPFGSSSIMIDKKRVSKDGFEIMNSLKADSEIATFVANMVRSITNKTLFTAGDGKTTAVLLAESLFRHLNEVYENYYSNRTPQEFIADVNEVAGIVVSRLNELKYTPKTKEDYLDIAYTSLNNDSQLVEYVDEVLDYFGEDEDPVIKTTENTETSKILVKETVGFDIPKTLKYGFASKNGLIEDVRTLVIGDRISEKHHVEAIHNIMDHCSDEGIMLLIVFADCSGYANKHIRNKIQRMLQNKRPVNTLFMKLSKGGTLEREAFYDDFCAYLDTTALVIDEDFEESVIESLDKSTKINIETKQYSTTLIVEERYGENVLYEERKQELKEIIKNGDESERSEAELRLNRITKKTVTISVGANTPEDRGRIYNMFQDATLAIQHSKEGIVSGMNTSVLKTINSFNSNQLSKNCNKIMDAIYESYSYLMELIIDKSKRDVSDRVISKIVAPPKEEKEILKAYDIKSEKISDNIVNSFKAEKVILEAALEIIKILITSNQIVFSDKYAANHFENLSKNMISNDDENDKVTSIPER